MSLFTSSDGSVWMVSSAKEIIKFPVWKGNRVLDQSHVAEIHAGVEDNIQSLDTNPFRVALIVDGLDFRSEHYIIDGQHRSNVLKKYFENNPGAPDFPVMVAIREFERDEDIIRYFRILNNTRAIQWKEDPVLVANVYIQALAREFNRDRRRLLMRPGRTVRPFLAIDKLRDTLVARHVHEWIRTPEEFVAMARRRNQEALENLKGRTVLEDSQARAIIYLFALGLDTTFSWIN